MEAAPHRPGVAKTRSSNCGTLLLGDSAPFFDESLPNMATKRYSLITRWHLEAPIERVWEALIAVEEWPRWWRFVQAVVELNKGDEEGVGAVRRYTWSSRLPYRLSFDMRTTALERPRLLEGVAVGELTGVGRWRLSPMGATTHVQYEWVVTTAKRWMNLLGPLLEPVFRWNHDQVMA